MDVSAELKRLQLAKHETKESMSNPTVIDLTGDNDIKHDNNISSNNDVNLDELIQQRIALENDIKNSDNQIKLLQNQQRILQNGMDKHTMLLSRYEKEMDELKKELTNISQTPNKRNNNNNNEIEMKQQQLTNDEELAKRLQQEFEHEMLANFQSPRMNNNDYYAPQFRDNNDFNDMNLFRQRSNEERNNRNRNRNGNNNRRNRISNNIANNPFIIQDAFGMFGNDDFGVRFNNNIPLRMPFRRLPSYVIRANGLNGNIDVDNMSYEELLEMFPTQLKPANEHDINRLPNEKFKAP